MKHVFTNGCFDILHYGHVRLLQYARSLGDWLTVATNSDASVRRLKGKDRPIVPCEERVKMLQALRCVDRVFVFDEGTPEALIAELQPDVLVKGPGHDVKEIPGARWVLATGGQVIVPDWEVTVSTTQLSQYVVREGCAECHRKC